MIPGESLIIATNFIVLAKNSKLKKGPCLHFFLTTKNFIRLNLTFIVCPLAIVGTLKRLQFSLICEILGKEIRTMASFITIKPTITTKEFTK